MQESLALTWRRIPERYGLLGNKCESCKTFYFPPRKICPKCRRKGKLVEHRFKGKGKVFAYSEITSPPVGFELEVPYILALVELEEGPKITAQLVGCTMPDVKIGSPVEVVFRKVQEDGVEGLIHYGYKFVLAK